MVLKPNISFNKNIKEFENDVKKYGTQTAKSSPSNICLFENDVKKYGTQTITDGKTEKQWFENDVKKYGTQTWRVESRRG